MPSSAIGLRAALDNPRGRSVPDIPILRLAGGAAAGVVTWVVFASVEGTLPAWLRAACVGAAVLFGPGAAVSAPLLKGLPAFRRIVLSFASGMAASPALAHILGKLDALAAYPYLATALAGGALAAWRHGRGAESARTPRRARAAALAITALAIGMGSVAYAHRIHEEPGRTVLYGDYDTYDVTYYAAIAAELSHTVPPESPFIAGRSLNHAFYPHLVVALIHRFGDVPILDLYFRYVWVAFLVLAGLTCFVFVRSIASTGVALLASVLLLMGSDLSYVAAWLGPPDTHLWDGVMWSANFASTGAASLLFNNWSPTLCVLFAGLYALGALEREGRPAGLLLASICFAVTAQFKPFAYGLILIGLAGGAVSSRAPGRRRLFMVAALTLVLSTPYVYRMLALTDDAPASVFPALLALPRIMLSKLNLARAFDAWAVALGAEGAARNVTSALLATPLFFVGGLGFRLIAVPSLWRIFRRPSEVDAIWRVLASTIVGAAVVPLVVAVSPYFETLQFYQLALFLLPIPVARVIVREGSRSKTLAVSAAVLALAVPSTLHYLQRKWTDQQRPFAQIREAERPVIELLRREDPNTTRVLHNRPRRSDLVGIEAERRSVLAWADYVGRKPDWIRVERFFEPVEPSSSDALNLLADARPTHVLEYRKADRLYPDVRRRLHLIYQNDEVALYSVPRELWGPGP